MSGAKEGVHVEGLDEFRKGLAKTNNPAAFKRELRKQEKAIGQKVAATARGEAASLGGPYSHFASYITGSSTPQGAAVGLRGNKANATFWGAERHTGWYADPRYDDSPPQHPKWVGSGWQAGGPGGPYAINPAIAKEEKFILDAYGDAVEHVASSAFPDKGGEGF